MGKVPKVIENEILSRELATLLIIGQDEATAAAQLKISTKKAREIIKSERFREIIAESADKEIGPALNRARGRLATLVDKAVSTIEKAMDTGEHKDALRAASMVLRGVGLEGQGQQVSDTNLTIVMPGAKTENVIEVIADKDTDNEKN